MLAVDFVDFPEAGIVNFWNETHYVHGGWLVRDEIFRRIDGIGAIWIRLVYNLGNLFLFFLSFLLFLRVEWKVEVGGIEDKNTVGNGYV
jgi:hypothetical protein